MFLKTKKAKIASILLLGICVPVSVFLYIQNSNNNENKEEINHFKPKEYEITDFDHLADDLSEALRVLLESKNYPGGFTYIFEYLASEEYKNELKKIGPKTNGVFVRLGDWIFEFQTGTVTGTCEQRYHSVSIGGTIDFEKKPMAINLEIKKLEHLGRK